MNINKPKPAPGALPNINEIVMDLRQATGSPENLHRAFFNILKPIYDAYNAALASEKEKGYDEGYEECRALWIKDPEIQQLRADNERLKQQYEMTALDCKNAREREAKLAESTKPLATANLRLVEALKDIASGIPDRKQMIEVAIAALAEVGKP